jgi:hypothetical protein
LEKVDNTKLYRFEKHKTKKEIKHEAYMRQDVNDLMGLKMMGR